MTDDRDPFLQSVFAGSQQTLEDGGFVAAVMARTTQLKRNLFRLAAILAILLIAASWAFSWPLLGIAMALTQVLGTEVFSVGNTMAAWFLTPVNNIATLMVIIWRLLRLGCNRATAISYIN